MGTRRESKGSFQSRRGNCNRRGNGDSSHYNGNFRLVCLYVREVVSKVHTESLRATGIPWVGPSGLTFLPSGPWYDQVE